MATINHAIVVLSAATLACSPAPVADVPAQTSPQTAEQWLGHFEKRLAKIKTLHADIVYETIDAVGVLDDRQTREGKLVFAAGTPKTDDKPAVPAKLSVHFTKLIIDRRPEKQDMQYVYDGRWWVERDNLEKIFTGREVLPPNAPPRQADPLSSGDGPFFFPVTAKKEQVLKRFDAELIAPAENDPPDTVHLRLKPKAGRRMEVTQLDIWYARTTAVPVRVETLDDAPNQKTVIVKKAALNQPVGPKVFDVTPPSPTDRGWNSTIEPYRGQVVGD